MASNGSTPSPTSRGSSLGLRSLHSCAHGWVEVLLADQIDDAGSLQVIIHVTVERAKTNVMDSSRSDSISSVNVRTPVASTWLRASASNTSQCTGAGAPATASRIRPLT